MVIRERKKAFLKQIAISIFSKIEIERAPRIFAVVFSGSNHSPHLPGKIHVNYQRAISSSSVIK
jgi:hypothetical protein